MRTFISLVLLAGIVQGCSVSAVPSEGGVEVDSPAAEAKAFGNQGHLPSARRHLEAAASALAVVGVTADGAYGVASTSTCPASGELQPSAESVENQLVDLHQSSAALVSTIGDLLGVYDANISEILANDPGTNISLPEGTGSNTACVSGLVSDAAAALEAVRKDVAALAVDPPLRGEGQRRQLIDLAVEAVAIDVRASALATRCVAPNCGTN
jgi:hypothetical protein